MSRLPVPGQDSGGWGDVLNDYLLQSHQNDGTLRLSSVGTDAVQDGAVTAAKLSTAVQTSLSKADSAIQEAPVTSVNALTGAVVLDKVSIGLSSVDNTSDASKPISAAVQVALDAKADTSQLGASVILIDNAAALPAGTPAGVIVVVKS